MSTATHSIPASLSRISGSSFGTQRRFPSVSPFVRAHFALRRLELEESDSRALRQQEESTLALIRELRRAADAAALA